jgi:hypothetical protein
MRLAPGIVAVGIGVSSCRAGAPQRMIIRDASVFDDGKDVRVAIDATVVADAPGRLAYAVGVWTAQPICGGSGEFNDGYLGFRIDIDPVDVGPRGDVRFVAVGGRRPACDRQEHLSGCGMPVSVTLLTTGDQLEGLYETFYDCKLTPPYVWLDGPLGVGGAP